MKKLKRILIFRRKIRERAESSSKKYFTKQISKQQAWFDCQLVDIRKYYDRKDEDRLKMFNEQLNKRSIHFRAAILSLDEDHEKEIKTVKRIVGKEKERYVKLCDQQDLAISLWEEETATTIKFMTQAEIVMHEETRDYEQLMGDLALKTVRREKITYLLKVFRDGALKTRARMLLQ